LPTARATSRVFRSVGHRSRCPRETFTSPIEPTSGFASFLPRQRRHHRRQWDPRYSGNNVAASSAELYSRWALGSILLRNVYIADSQNDIVRELTVSNAASLPAVSKGGVVSAAQFGALASPAPGSWIEIYGSNLATDSRAWTTGGFHRQHAPTFARRHRGDRRRTACVCRVHQPGQVNVQVPSTAPTARSRSWSLRDRMSASRRPSPSAPPRPVFMHRRSSVGGNQYAGALFRPRAPRPGFLAPGAVTGLTSQRAKPGDFDHAIRPSVSAGTCPPGRSRRASAIPCPSVPSRSLSTARQPR